MNAMTVSRLLGAKYVALAVIICVMYAISDEVHQLYVPGRSGEVRDVLVDSLGAVVGIGGFLGVYKIRAKHRKNA